MCIPSNIFVCVAAHMCGASIILPSSAHTYNADNRKGVRMKDKLWKLFQQTGNPCYYLLYKELTKDNGRNHQSDSSPRDGLQGKR